MPLPAAHAPRSLNNPTPRPVPGAAAQAFAIPPRTLLLVEDSRFAAEAVRLVCRRAGIRLRRADSLASAALHLRVYRPDIALIDLGLPDGSGLELIAALARSSLRPPRLVAVSGEARLEEAAMAAGAEAFLLKPVSLAQHLALLTGEHGAVLPAGAGWSGDGEALRDRNAGADPLALRDDLRRVRELLSLPERGDAGADAAPPASGVGVADGFADDSAPGAAGGSALTPATAGADRLRYAGQLLASVGRALRDTRLAEAAEAATAAGDRRSLVALTQSRALRMPVI